MGKREKRVFRKEEGTLRSQDKGEEEALSVATERSLWTLTGQTRWEGDPKC